MKQFLLVFYAIILFLLTLFTWGFVDANFPLKILPSLHDFVFTYRSVSTVLYTFLYVSLFICYGFLLWLIVKKRADIQYVKLLIAITVVIFFFSFPAFAYDIFNYIATAKVTFLYRENPYIIMPIEIPNEPMLSFMHAANKVSLYGFVWIALTGLPWFLGLGNLLLTIFTFKALEVFFYLLSLVLIWKLSDKNLKALAFFALNPLVTTETLISAHNDIVMMALVLGAFYAFKKQKIGWSAILLFLSIFIKFATVILLPVFIYLIYLRNRKINWEEIWRYSAILMYIPFFLSPLREEIYSWYLIWPITFASLAKEGLLAWVTVGFSFGLPFRFAPYLLTGSWAGLTPLIKKIVTFAPPIVTAGYHEIRKKI